MKDNPPKPTTKKSLTDSARATVHVLQQYSVILFLLLLAGVYGFVTYRIYVASSVQPTEEAISAQLEQTATPHIDPTAVKQLQSLQDRSVNVKTLFDQARTNPFGE